MRKADTILRTIVLTAAVIVSVPQLRSQDTIRFDHGLITGGGGVFSDRSAFTADPVAWLFVTGRTVHPVEGELSFTPQMAGIEAMPVQENNGRRQAEWQQKPPVWQKITADTSGYFSSHDVRGGGLYLEYNSPSEKTMILEVAGNTMSIVNGVPLEGDVYNWDISLRPVRIKKGLNTIYLTMGRFQGVKAMLVKPRAEVQITPRDMTMPDLIIEEQSPKYAAVQVINSSSREMKGYSLRCIINGRSEVMPLPALAPENTRKMPFLVPSPGEMAAGEVTAQLVLLTPAGREADRFEFKLKNKHFSETHDRTFVSAIDGSVQYYSVTPGGTGKGGEALFLSVHGAGVEARNQARAYKSKDWGNLAAATNRRPYGYNWEDWGRMDALEVLDQAKKLFNPDPARIYLTGHSMGGHGTWHLGATYPSYFAAIAPSAGYPDLLNYGFRSGVSSKYPAGEMMLRANNQSRTLLLARNYLHYGVYVFHGDADETVPVEQAREMRKLLGTFHPDFAYYEYPGGHHWISDESVDWPPVFEFFKRHTIPSGRSLQKIEFHTACPGISATSHWLTISQQQKALSPSGVVVTIDTATNSINATTENTALFSLNTADMSVVFPLEVMIDSVRLTAEQQPAGAMLWFERKDGTWAFSTAPSAMEKNPVRSGPFKDAFKNNMVFVYGTGGSRQENEWLYWRARYDASTFGYRGNASIEIISDREFNAADQPDRNVILYGNKKTNSAWSKVLSGCPVEVGEGFVRVDAEMYSGDDLACFFIWPRSGSETASVGVIASTGLRGLRGAFTNQYLNSGSGFPDITIVSADAPVKGYESVIMTGFFGNDWQVTSGEFLRK